MVVDVSSSEFVFEVSDDSFEKNDAIVRKFRFVMLISLVLIIICDVIDRNRKSNRNVNIN